LGGSEDCRSEQDEREGAQTKRSFHLILVAHLCGTRPANDWAEIIAGSLNPNIFP
jgi:hypothetical protein